ncbi:hypothetical protein BAPNAU_1775 [Bacillus velezensis NAU-B3]|nr:hypothetical protein BAPNAU_1775 [Bacillus velezensis NAU-B3]
MDNAKEEFSSDRFSNKPPPYTYSPHIKTLKHYIKSAYD